ncbi:AAA family ATPase [Intestinibacter sp.]
MILEFTCKNFRSIKDYATLSMLAINDKKHEENLIQYEHRNILPVASIYGANGSGKTNLIKAVKYLKRLVSESNNFQPGDKLLIDSHKLSQEDNSEFQIQFISSNIRYAYGFIINQNYIVEEYLYHFKNGKQAKIFYRQEEEYTFGKEYKTELNEISNKYSKNNKLFLSLSANLINNIDIKNVFLFIKEDLIVYDGNETNMSWLDFTLEEIGKDKENKEKFIKILNSFGMDIQNIKIDRNIIDSKNLSLLLPNLPEKIRRLIDDTNSISVATEARIIYKNMEIPLMQESNGVKKIFELIGPMVDILSEGKVIFYDELETSLHPMIVKRIIEMFLKKEINQNNSQLIFSTHDVNLLDLDIFRRDQIWITEKKTADKSTDLYSLSDLKNIRNDENIENGYIKGKYGGIPHMNKTIWKI